MEEETELRDARVYELGYLLLPTVGDANVPEQVAALKKIISEQGGVEIAEGRAEIIELAYTMDKVIDNVKHHFDTAYFGWIKFEVAPEKIETIATAVTARLQVLRHLLVKTLRENTMPIKRAPLGARRKDGTEPATTVADESADISVSMGEDIVNPEALDKHIEELVTPIAIPDAE